MAVRQEKGKEYTVTLWDYSHEVSHRHPNIGQHFVSPSGQVGQRAGAPKEAPSSMQHVSVIKTRLVGSGCSPGMHPKGCAGDGGKYSGCARKEEAGDRAPSHHPASPCTSCFPFFAWLFRAKF